MVVEGQEAGVVSAARRVVDYLRKFPQAVDAVKDILLDLLVGEMNLLDHSMVDGGILDQVHLAARIENPGA